MFTLQKQADGSIGFTKVKGHKIKIEGFEDFNFFYYKTIDKFFVIEQRSGQSIASTYRLKDAKWKAKDRLESHGKEDFTKARDKAVETNGLPPGID